MEKKNKKVRVGIVFTKESDLELLNKIEEYGEFRHIEVMRYGLVKLLEELQAGTPQAYKMLR